MPPGARQTQGLCGIHPRQPPSLGFQRLISLLSLESLAGEYELAIEAEQRQLRQVERRHGVVVRFAVCKGKQLTGPIRLLVYLAIVDTHLFRGLLSRADEPLEPIGPLTLASRMGRRRRRRFARSLAFVRPLAHFVSEGFAASGTDVGQSARVDPPMDHVRHPLAERFPFGNKRVESILVLAPTWPNSPHVSQE